MFLPKLETGGADPWSQETGQNPANIKPDKKSEMPYNFIIHLDSFAMFHFHIQFFISSGIGYFFLQISFTIYVLLNILWVSRSGFNFLIYLFTISLYAGE